MTGRQISNGFGYLPMPTDTNPDWVDIVPGL